MSDATVIVKTGAMRADHQADLLWPKKQATRCRMAL